MKKNFDLVNNGFGEAFTDIMSGIVTLSLGDEPLEDGDPFSCYFDFDASGNNTIDFGFYNPNISSITSLGEEQNVRLFPNPATNSISVQTNWTDYEVEIWDALGKLHFKDKAGQSVHSIDKTIYRYRQNS